MGNGRIRGNAYGSVVVSLTLAVFIAVVAACRLTGRELAGKMRPRHFRYRGRVRCPDNASEGYRNRVILLGHD